MKRSKWVNYGLFFLGVFLIVGGAVASIGAFDHQFALDSSAKSQPSSGQHVFHYKNLNENQKHVVDGAIGGKQYTLDTATAIPGIGQSLTGEKVTVVKGDTYYTFSHEAYFAATKPPGLAVIGLVLGGIVAIIEGVRRQHFPHRRLPWQVGG